jgi:hypothetical protein
MNDVLQEIFTFLTAKEVIKVSQVCQQWSTAIVGTDEVAQEVNVLWYRLLLRDYSSSIPTEELTKMIENSRLLHYCHKDKMNKGQLKRMRRNKKHLKKRSTEELSHENFKLRELANYWRRMYFNTMENSKRCDTVESNMKDLYNKISIYSWRNYNCKHDLTVQSEVEQGITKHSAHCKTCNMIVSTTELSISKKVYGDFYGQNRLPYFPLKLFPVNFYHATTGDGDIHPLSRGQDIHKLWNTRFRFGSDWNDEYLELEENTGE